MPPRQLPGPGQSPTTNGTIDAVRCPHCGKPNDFRVLQEQQLLDTGHEVECDHCHHLMEVAAIRPVTVITVRKEQQRRRAAPGPATAQQASTLSPGQLRRLLGR